MYTLTIPQQSTEMVEHKRGEGKVCHCSGTIDCRDHTSIGLARNWARKSKDNACVDIARNKNSGVVKNYTYDVDSRLPERW